MIKGQQVLYTRATLGQKLDDDDNNMEATGEIKGIADT